MPESAALSMMSPTLLVVARFRSRGLSLRPINSVKEIVDSTLLGVSAATVSTVAVASAVNDYIGTVGTLPVGAKISSIFLFVQIIETATTSNVDWFVAKFPGGLGVPVPGATGGTAFRKYILHEEKGIPGNSNDGAYPSTFKGVIRIPRGRQRFAEGDLIQVRIRGTGIYNACLKCIYKAYR